MDKKLAPLWGLGAILLLMSAWHPQATASSAVAAPASGTHPTRMTPPSSATTDGYFVPGNGARSLRTLNVPLPVSLDETSITYAVADTAVTCTFVGATTTALVGEDRSSATTNTYKGSDRAAWRTGEPLYRQARYDDLYPGIDLVYRLPGGSVKSEFVLEPGSDVSRIRVQCPGVAVSVDRGGSELVLKADPSVELRETLPIAYQPIQGAARPVAVSFDILDAHTYTYKVHDDLDPAYPLIIDPLLLSGISLGGSGTDEGWSIAVDPEGNTYISGVTTSQDFPSTGTTGPVNDKDVFLAKFDRSGALAYATVIGGASGEEGNAIAVDHYGNAYVAGETFSRDFPLLNPWQPTFAGYEDAFLLKVNPDGQLSYATYIGGARGDEVNDMVADAVGNVYLGGEVYSDDYPLLDPWSSNTYGEDEEDGFITIFNALGEMVYSTLVGAPARDQVFEIAVDAAGYVYGTGMTSSPDFPTVNALQTQYGGDWDDCFVFKLDPWNNEMIYATLLGGNGRDECWGIAVDDTGAAYVTGFTSSDDFPLVDPLQSSLAGWDDLFVAKLSPTGQSLLFSTYLGGTARDRAWDLALDGGGNVYVVGETESPDFPLAHALQASYRGGMDGFLLVLDDRHALRYSSYIGGEAYDRAYGLTLHNDGVAHVVGGTASSALPIAESAAPLSGGTDAFVTSYGLVPTPTPTPTPIPQASAVIGSEGGAVWLTYPGHVTILTVPGGYVSDRAVFTLTYERLPNHQGDLTGLNHFFALDTDLVPPPAGSSLLPSPLDITMAYAPGAVVEESIALYGLRAGAWTTESILTLSKEPQFLRVTIDRSGIYGLLGESNRLYLPAILRP